MTQLCSVCFHENPQGVVFCEACGIELIVAPPEPTPPSTPTRPEPFPTPTPPSTPDPFPTPPSTPDPFPPTTPEPIPPIPPVPPIPETVPPTVATYINPTVSKTTIQHPPSVLICKNPGAPVEKFPLEGNSVLIGRFDPDLGPVEIDLEGFPGDDTISRNHAEIYLETGCWKIKDLGSVNGVFIKKEGQARFGPRITSPEVIAMGDEISIAKVRFLLQ